MNRISKTTQNSQRSGESSPQHKDATVAGAVVNLPLASPPRHKDVTVAVVNPLASPPRQMGVTVEADGVSFCTDQVGGEDSGVIIYDERDNACRFPFPAKGRRGCLSGLKVHMKITAGHSYLYYQGQETFVDREAKILTGNNIWGASDGGKETRGGFYLDDFAWGDDAHPETPYRDSIIYGLNVRAFTMHRSSGVKKKGTFAGIVEKIPYFRELGVTAIELMPAYDYSEYETFTRKKDGEEAARLNCWGFKDAWYYAPKSAFAGAERPDIAFKKMVKSLHQNGLEIYMYFYFSPDFCRTDILDILRFWVLEYHLDGVHLLGVDIPVALITQDRIMSGTKIIYSEYEYWEEKPRYRNTAVYCDHFRTEIRRLIKGDDDLIGAFLRHHRNIPADRGNINYLADYGGFSLYDMTAYDKKKNESNGEENSDGTNYNYSWNCGVEGPSRKESIVALRHKQQKNALSLLFLSQGTPFIFGGDEFGNTRFGNNNVYCQDNDAGWVKWPRQGTKNYELFSFTKELIRFRKSHPIVHMPSELRVLDWLRCGYPDISYHGEEAWRPDLEPYSHAVGIMLCGKYARRKNKSADDFIFIAVNMHWQERSLALPHLPKELKWRVVFTTEREKDTAALKNSDSVLLKERSVCVLISAKAG